MFWGTYSPHLYFGLKTRSTRPARFGIMWNNIYQFGEEEVRHEGQKSRDVTYGWSRHNGQTFGHQEILDTKNNVKIITQFVKNVSNDDQNGGNWMARVSVHKISKEKKTKHISMLFYMSLEGEDDYVDFNGKTNKKGSVSPIHLSGKCEKIGNFQLLISDNGKEKSKYNFLGNRYKSEDIWKVKHIVNEQYYQHFIKERKKQMREMKDSEEPMKSKPIFVTLNNRVMNKREKSNLIVVQKVVDKYPYVFDITFLNDNTIGPNKSKNRKKIIKWVKKNAMGNSLTKMIKNERKKFENKFEDIFNINQKYQEMSYFALSNLIGGMGYFHGDIIYENKMKMKHDNSGIHTKILSQFSTVPSRSKFPRPFLWDSGFEVEIVLKWNKQIGMDMLEHWFNTMDSQGWIPREQIFGDEGRQFVPEKFQIQKETIGNPPTLFLAIENNFIKTHLNVNEIGHINKLQDSSNEDITFLRRIYPNLQKNYKWYMHTQKIQNEFAFQWKERTENHTLASGFDDYPRSLSHMQKYEKHVDLYCWLYMITRTLKNIAFLINENNDHLEYTKMMEKFEKNFEKIHFDSSLNLYADFIGKHIKNTTKNGFSKHIGYVSLLPYISGLIQDDMKAQEIIKIMSSKDILNSNFGLRSLSKRDDLYGTQEDYWRGKIWININYLALRTLKREGKYEKLYKELRSKVVKNIHRNFVKYGSLFENYNCETGKGDGTRPFTGWTSLVLLILSEKY